MAKFDTIADIDFDILYQKHFKLANRSVSTSISWDDRAQLLTEEFDSANPLVDDDYLTALLPKIEVSSNDIILDVGCGAGNLALRLAPKVKHVYGLDFSKKMLDLFQQKASHLNIDNYDTILKSWYESWAEIPLCDICISSRSSMVPDIKQALDLLNQKARKSVYMTMVIDQEFLNRELYKLLNRDHLVRFPSYIYAVNILYQQGYLVSVDFIDSEHKTSESIGSEDQFIEVAQSIVGELSASEKILLQEYYQGYSDNLMPLNTNGRVWALLSWHK